MRMNNSQEISGEMHFKMCKKIAQLTKVIFMLNTKLDDHEEIYDKLKSDHEEDKIKFMTATNQKLQSYKTVIDQLAVFQSKYQDLEKSAYKYQEREKELERRYKELSENSETIISKCKTDCANKLISSASEIISYKKALENATEGIFEKTSQSESKASEWEQKFAAMSTQKDAEIQKLEEKIQKMIDDQSSSTDQRIQELQNRLNFKEQEFSNIMQSHKLQISESNALHMSELQSLTLSHDEKETQLTNQIGILEKQLLEGRQEIDRLRKTNDDVIASMETKSNDASTLSDRLTAKQKECFEVQEALAALKRTSQMNATKLSGQDKEIGELKKKLDSQMDENRDAKGAISKMKEDFSIVKKRLMASESERAAGERENEKLKEKLAKNEKAHATEKQELLEKIDKLKNRTSSEKNSMEEAMSLKEKQHQMAMETLKLQLNTELDEKIAKIRSEAEIEMNKISENSRKLIDLKKNEWESEAAKMQEKIDRLTNNQSASAQEAEAQISILKERLACLKDAKEKCEGELENTSRKHSESEAQLRSKLEELSKLKEEKNALEKKYQNDTNELQKRISVLEGKLKDTREKAEKDLADTIQQKDLFWHDKMEKEIARIRETFDKSRSENMSSLEKSITDRYEKSIETIRKDAENEARRLNEEMEEFRKTLNSERKEHCEALEDAKEEKKREEKSLRETFDSALQEKMVEIERLTEKIARMQEDFETEMKSTREGIEGESLKREHASMHSQQVAHRAVLDNVKKQNDAEKKRALEQLRQQLEVEHAASRSALERGHVGDISQLKAQHERELASLKTETSTALGQAQRKEDELSAALETSKNQTREITSELSDSKRRTSRLEGRIVELTSELDVKAIEMSKFAEVAEMRLREREEELIEQNSAEIAQCERVAKQREGAQLEEFRKAQSLLATKIAELTDALDESQLRFERRESRPEDLAIIQELKDRLRAKSEELNRMKSEKKFYELELVNRETNFNRVFGSNGPQVGVLDPLGGPSSATKKPPVPRQAWGSSANQPRASLEPIDPSSPSPTLRETLRRGPKQPLPGVARGGGTFTPP